MPATIWLVANQSSGSTADGMIDSLERSFAAAGITVRRRIAFPDEALPTAAELDAAGIGCLAVLGGDGTINSVLAGLYGWDGAVLVLPGGTMNLLSRSLHGEAAPDAVIAALGRAQRLRPPVVRTASEVAPDAFGGLMVGPGTAWNHVREAIRSIDIAGIIAKAADAITRSTTGPMVTCAGIPGAREDGYSLIMLTPDRGGLIVEGYYAQSVGDYTKQGIALLRRDFRLGPHDDLGRFPQITVRSPEGGAMGLLVDGEPNDGAGEMTFRLAEAGVDLIATAPGPIPLPDPL